MLKKFASSHPALGWACEKGDIFSIPIDPLLGTADRRYHSPACDTLGCLSACLRGSASSERIPFGSCPLPQRRAESDGCSISSHYLSRSPDLYGSDGAGPPWPASCMERWAWPWILPPRQAS